MHGDTSTPAGPAFKTKGGRTVYGGGGITPDIFVPFDTASQPAPVIQLYIKNTLNNFVYTYYMQNKTYLQTFKTPLDLAKQFTAGEKEWQQLTNFAKRDSIDLASVDSKAKAELLEKFPAQLARQIWRSEGFYEVSNVSDPMIKKALEVK